MKEETFNTLLKLSKTISYEHVDTFFCTDEKHYYFTDGKHIQIKLIVSKNSYILSERFYSIMGIFMNTVEATTEEELLKKYKQRILYLKLGESDPVIKALPK